MAFSPETYAILKRAINVATNNTITKPAGGQTGDVLTYNGTTWVAQAPSTTGGLLINLTSDPDAPQGQYADGVTDKTDDEILTAYNNGRRIRAFLDRPQCFLELSRVDPFDTGLTFVFVRVGHNYAYDKTGVTEYYVTANYHGVGNSSFTTAFNCGELDVLFTPTAQDYSGVMDKQAQTISEAYNAGLRIVAEIYGMNMKLELNNVIDAGGSLYKFEFLLVGSLDGVNEMLGRITTNSNSANDMTYSVHLYSLTSIT